MNAMPRRSPSAPATPRAPSPAPQETEETQPKNNSNATEFSNHQDRPLGLGKFNTEDPITWLEQAEFQFDLRNITDGHRQATLLAEALPTPVWRSVSHLYMDRTNRPTYEDIREELLDRWQPTAADRAQQIFSDLGKPAERDNLSVAFHSILNLTRLPKTATKPTREIDLKMDIALQRFDVKILEKLPDYTTMDRKKFLASTVVPRRPRMRGDDSSNPGLDSRVAIVTLRSYLLYLGNTVRGVEGFLG